jgi:hypothetical protein
VDLFDKGQTGIFVYFEIGGEKHEMGSGFDGFRI